MLLRVTPVRTGAIRPDAEMLHHAFADKGLRIGLPRAAHDPIGRQRQVIPLKDLLQLRLRVFSHAFGEVREDLRVEPQDDGLSLLKTAVQKHRAENRFHGVRKDRGAAAAA